mgnify:CR=1 FL=1
MTKMVLSSVAAIALALSVGACTLTDVTNKITDINTKVSKYAPIIGKDLLMVGNILVQAECSPIVTTGSTVINNVLTIVAPTSAAAATVAGVLATNEAVASQLCPLVQAVNAVVGTIPAGKPTQTIPATVGTIRGKVEKLPVIWNGKTVAAPKPGVFGDLPVLWNNKTVSP